MATVIATAGASDANSFVTVADCTTYLDGRLNTSAWTAASADDKARAVISATRLLNGLRYLGSTVSETQALQWPRAYVPNPDAPFDADPTRPFDEVVYYVETEIPQRIVDATCELALEFLNAGTTDFAALDGDANLTSKTIGPISKTWAAAGKPQGMARFPLVLNLLRPLLRPVVNRMVRA